MFRRGVTPGPLRSLIGDHRTDPLVIAIIATIAMASAFTIPAVLGRKPDPVAAKPAPPGFTAAPPLLPKASPAAPVHQAAVAQNVPRDLPPKPAALPVAAPKPPPPIIGSTVPTSAARQEPAAASSPIVPKRPARTAPPTLSLDMLPVLALGSRAIESESAKPPRRGPVSQRRAESELRSTVP